MTRVSTLVIVSALVACGGSDSNNNPSPPATQNTPLPPSNPLAGWVGTWLVNGLYSFNFVSLPSTQLIVGPENRPVTQSAEDPSTTVILQLAGLTSGGASPCNVPLRITGNLGRVPPGFRCTINTPLGERYNVEFTNGTAQLTGNTMSVSASGNFDYIDGFGQTYPGQFILSANFNKVS